MLAERWRVAPDRAFDVLRRAARTHQLSLRSLAEDVVAPARRRPSSRRRRAAATCSTPDARPTGS